MTKRSATECEIMKRVQKTAMLPEDLYRFVADQERRTGVTFTRLCVAAFLKFFLSEPQDPDMRWMRYAVDIERDALTVADVGLEHAKEIVRSAQATLNIADQEDQSYGVEKTLLNDAKKDLFDAQSVLSEWNRILHTSGSDGTTKIIAYRQTPNPVVTPETHPNLFFPDENTPQVDHPDEPASNHPEKET